MANVPLRSQLLLVLLAAICCLPTAAQETAETAIEVPVRPSFTNPADTTPKGELEIELSVGRDWGPERESSTGLNGTYWFGITNSFDIQWSTDHFLKNVTPSGAGSGTGDNWFGARLKVREQTRILPALAFLYQVKVPTSSTENEIGSGLVDHGVGILFSKDVGTTRADWNVVRYAWGTSAGWRSSTMLSLALSRTVKKKVGALLEVYSGHDCEGLSSASILTAASWRWNDRTTSDIGFEFGWAAGAPTRKVVAGVSYAVGNPWRIGNLLRRQGTEQAAKNRP